MNELALFAGIGGGLLASRILGWRTICAVEINRYRRDILLQRQMDGWLDMFPIWDDVRTFNGHAWCGRVDVVSGGFPCQDISSCGPGGGLSGKRSGLWFEMSRIIREVRPRSVFIENSPLLRRRGLDIVLRDLAAMGFNARWGVVRANEAGADHQRARMWIAAHAHSYRLERGNNRVTKWQAATRSVAGLRENKVFDDLPPPDAFGMSNGIPRRVERTSAIGDAQCPQQAALAWRLLNQ